MNQLSNTASDAKVANIDHGSRLRTAVVALLVSQAVLLVAILWVLRGGGLGPAAASADDRMIDGGVANVGPRQRKSMMDSLAAIERRLGEIDARLAEGVVRVEIADAESRR
jgi:hypothetical protein